MVQQHELSLAGNDPAQTPREAVLRFSPADAVRAIVFHLIDERKADSVCPETVRRTIQRMTERSIEPSIPRHNWAAMSNPQRLRWMLDASQTVTIAGANNTIRLRGKRSK